MTTLEDLSVELFYEIFTYFQLHEIWKSFSNLNSRITAMIENLSSISVFLGSSGMNIEVTYFYYKHLLQTNICTHLTSLCVSDTSSVDNGRWFAGHGWKFLNLRHLSLIDLQRSIFEMILNSLSPIDSLIIFSVHFTSADNRAAYTFRSVPEGVYRERIFRLFPALRACHLLFGEYLRYTIDTSFIPLFSTSFMPVQRNLFNLQSLTLRYCLPRFLADLFEHLPRLVQFSCLLYEPIWTSKEHLIEYDSQNQSTPINKRLAPNLRRLKINWVGKVIDMNSIDMLFDCDVLLALTNFTLLAQITDLNVLHNVLFKLSSECSYQFDVTWYVMDDVSLSNTSDILSHTLEQFKGPVPIELELVLERNHYVTRAMTLPRMDRFFCVGSYLRENVVHRQSSRSSNKQNSNNRWHRFNELRMSPRYDQTNGAFLSLHANLISWDRIRSIHMLQPFNSTYLHVLFSQAINLRTLSVEYVVGFCKHRLQSKDPTLIEFLNDESLCNILMSNGLRQLNLFTGLGDTNLTDLAHRIVERLPHLETIEVNSDSVEINQIAPIFINGLSKLSFLALSGCLEIYFIYEKKIPLYTSRTRSIRMDMWSADPNLDTLLLWL